MSKFWMLTEDPMYDDDGVLVDEDADWEEFLDKIPEELDAALGIKKSEEFSPYVTVNS